MSFFCHINALEDTVNLSKMIEEFFPTFKILFPAVNPINKFHHLIHYPELIRQNGPSMGYWCMRFEGHHNLYKRVSQFNCNFKNTTKSVANHLALSFCSNLQDKDAFVDNRITIGPSSGSEFEKLNILDEDKIFENNEHVEVLSWIKIGGWLFFEDTVVVLKRSNVKTNLLHKFGKICKLIVGKKVSHMPLSKR